MAARLVSEKGDARQTANTAGLECDKASYKALAESHQESRGLKTDLETATEYAVTSGWLPDLHLTDKLHTAEAAVGHLGNSVWGELKHDKDKVIEIAGDVKAVAKEFGKGAVDEVVHHPGHLVKSAAIGAVIGVAAVLVAPEIMVGAAVVGAGVAAYEVAKHAGGWVHDAKVVAHPENYSQDEVEKARTDVRGLGAGAIDTAAGVVGGMGGGWAASTIKSKLAQRAAAALEKNSVSTEVQVLAPEVQQSIRTNQGVFQSAHSDNSVLTVRKQDYNVMFKKVTEPTQITTLESKAAGSAGEQLQPGQWIATRLDAAGKPVIEDGITNQWAVTEKAMLKAYKIDPQELQGTSKLIAATKTDGPAVHMVPLDRDLTIRTSWGQMSGKAGDYLTNYDFNPVTGQAGQDFAIVTKTSFKQTYEAIANK
jgi:hypothetical protein